MIAAALEGLAYFFCEAVLWMAARIADRKWPKVLFGMISLFMMVLTLGAISAANIPGTILFGFAFVGAFIVFVISLRKSKG